MVAERSGVMSKHTFMDVQGFAGGFSMGVTQAGLQLIGKCEMKGAFGAANMEANRHLLGNKWDLQVGPQESWENRGAEVVIGNPPCSAFSPLSAKGFRGMGSPVAHCMWAMAQYAARANPYIVTFESVQQAYNQGLPMMRDIRTWLEYETNDKWELYHVLHNNASVGGASIRKRYFWVASRIPFGIEEPTIKRVPLLHDVLGDLMGLGQTWEPQPYRRKPSWWAEHLRSESGAVDGHIGRNDALDVRRALQLLEGTYWNEGEVIGMVAKRYYEEHGCLPSLWGNMAEKWSKKEWQVGFHQPNKLKWDKMARVITGAVLHKNLHPREDRFLTHREAARIQGFPDDWLIRPLQGVSGLSMTWGKGIPVHAGKWLGKWIKRALDDNPGEYTGELIGEREHVIDFTNVYRQVTSER
jgi:site-specific DNA-cytosine methylase